MKDVYQHDPLWSSTPTALSPPELRYFSKAAIIRRLTSSRCYDRMLREWNLVPRALGHSPSLKVTEILPILHDGERGDGQRRQGGAYESKSHCCLGFHPGLTAHPRPPDQLYSADSSLVGNWGEAAQRSLTEHVARAPAVLILIIDQMIKAHEEIFF